MRMQPLPSPPCSGWWLEAARLASTSVPYVNTRQRLIRKLVLFAQIEESSPIDISRDEPAFFWYAPQTRNGSGGPHVAAVAAVVAVAAVWYIHGGSRSGRGLRAFTHWCCREGREAGEADLAHIKVRAGCACEDESWSRRRSTLLGSDEDSVGGIRRQSKEADRACSAMESSLPAGLWCLASGVRAALAGVDSWPGPWAYIHQGPLASRSLAPV
ncbi:hypothetical protein VFPBJ_08550 [Purpureocillium lilacinum]|uniref:Uncharacterized protein n=1 Tax=Purpureocillium lilacinum TaxID=33203 RepID=A0A179GFF9_PURLI|nr:hypothetical protein VFPBJ_08550 [Purpureocillium lilacinum]